ncbi:hypothetical protein PVAP13_9KG183055 [Panicum virgatum]|uniref:Uncharacterized protein n=1 Tax=Panicum virgatum TaxID=38727 RepID=A0A8T0NGQ7_PANVG|nr:hypothetical protein PVAP13_9KG183055 [Panicum virgatum]
MAWRYLSMSMCGSSGGDSSEEEEIEAATLVASIGSKWRWGGSVIRHKTYKRDRLAIQIQLDKDYFGEEPFYDEDQFRRRFRMRKSLFMRIVTEVTAANSFFVQKKCCWQDGFLSASQMHGCYEDACIWNCS